MVTNPVAILWMTIRAFDGSILCIRDQRAESCLEGTVWVMSQRVGITIGGRRESMDSIWFLGINDLQLPWKSQTWIGTTLVLTIGVVILTCTRYGIVREHFSLCLSKMAMKWLNRPLMLRGVGVPRESEEAFWLVGCPVELRSSKGCNTWSLGIQQFFRWFDHELSLWERNSLHKAWPEQPIESILNRLLRVVGYPSYPVINHHHLPQVNHVFDHCWALLAIFKQQ